VIDDHPIVLQGCRQFLEDAGIGLIVEARTLAEGFRLYRDHEPDLIIVDLTMGTGGFGGLAFIRQLRSQDKQTPILVFTMHSDPMIVSRTLELGATGYVLKDGPFEELAKALIEVRKGKPYVSQELTLGMPLAPKRE
jgi:DNA-binding NarL/FixJ family response regulator